MPAKTIVVGAGGGPAGWQTLAWAVAHASLGGSHLVVCHVCPPDSLLAQRGNRAPLGVLEMTDPALARAMAAARDRLGAHRVTLAVHTGHLGRAIVAAASGADLLVVGPPSRTNWTGRPSTTHHVVRHAPCPLVVVRLTRPVPGSPFAGHVVVGVDGSRPSRAAVRFGFDWAAAHRQPLAAVHVTRSDHDVWYDETTPETWRAVEPPGFALLTEEVDRWRPEYPGVAVKRGLYGGRPLDGLLHAAGGARLLVVGDRGQNPATRAVLGSVAHGAVDRADCPLAVVHADLPPAVPGDLTPATAGQRHQQPRMVLR